MLQGKNLATVSKLLRRQMTPWEAKLWYYLRGRRFYGFKFKRQVPMGDYVVDFCCQEKKLVIELDGSGHVEEETKIRDREKQEYLKDNGYKVLRFWNNEVENNIQGVLEIINKELHK